MRYYKMISNEHLLSVGTGGNTGEEITEAEYITIMDTIRNAPTAPDGYGYSLTAELEWELYELPVMEVEDELTETEQKARAYDILTGVSE